MTFIAFEGIDGSGKTTLIEPFQKAVQVHLLAQNKTAKVQRTREPGGSELAEQIRTLIMHYDMHIQAEILLMYAARVDHFQKTILPALNNGDVVLTDRYFYSSFAYQGGGQNGSFDLLNDLQHRFQQEFSELCLPDYLIFLDVEVEVALERRKARRAAQISTLEYAGTTTSTNTIVDKFEAFDIDFQHRVYAAYHQQIKDMDLFNSSKNEKKEKIADKKIQPKTKLIKINARQSIEDAQKDLLAVIPLIFP